MNVIELKKYLEELIENGYGDYTCIREGYADDLQKTDIEVNVKRKEVWI